jgi:GNAT superfamily N-acetyltransferase
LNSLRDALPSEANLLTAIAARSKAHWPYDQEYLREAARVTQVTPVDIEKYCFRLIEEGGRILGFYGLARVKNENMLDHLWIEPEFIGQGVGKILFSDATLSARTLGWTKFTIASDPYAEEFYLKQGARRIGQRESKIRPGFFLPLLEYIIDSNERKDY